MKERKLIKVSRGYKVMLDVITYVKRMYQHDIDLSKIRYQVVPNFKKKELKLKFKKVR